MLSKMTAMEIDEEYDYEAMYKLQLQEIAKMKEEIENLKTENEKLHKEVADTFEALTELQEENMKLNNDA
jgi:FtsZ-binding cell division protein ZapB